MESRAAGAIRAALEPTTAASATDRAEVGAAPAEPATYLYAAATPRLRLGATWSAYVKIAEGCDQTCAFCAIPSFRGRFRSRPLDDIVLEAERLAGEGVAEIGLVAQDSTAYGLDLGMEEGAARLLEGLARIDGLRWIRLYYLYPNRVSDRLLDVLGSGAPIARYIDLPLQHASRPVLARMRRGGTAESHLRLLERIRARVPGATLRTTLITGFPGETEQDFEAACSFLEAARFDTVGVFTYSHEERTAARDLADDVPAEVKEERRRILLEIQEPIAQATRGARVGETVSVLCEGEAGDLDGHHAGRLEGQAPEIDGRVLFTGGGPAAGRFCKVRLTEAGPHDFIGAWAGPA
jgi:ribosomal protein S12 methylthiotransferase